MIRKDKRKNNELRKIKLRRNYLKFAEGSSLIELGGTKVICSASVEDKVPPFLRNTKSGWVTAEYGMLPRSAPERIVRESSRGKVGGRTHEIQRLIGRSLRSVVDLEAFAGRTIWIDCDVIQADGGTRTASITGSFIALVEAFDKMRTQGILDRIPVRDYVAATSVGVLQGEPILDLTYEEDSRAEVDMNVVITGSGRFVEIQATAEKHPFNRKRLSMLLTLAQKGIGLLIAEQKKIIGSILQL